MYKKVSAILRRDCLFWTQLERRQVIWSNKSTYMLFYTNCRTFVLQTQAEALKVHYIVHTAKKGRDSVMCTTQYIPALIGALHFLREIIIRPLLNAYKR